MATPTPTKRRKTNNFKSSPQTVGSLDLFFQKHKNAQSSDKTAAPPSHIPDEEHAVDETLEPDEKISPDHGAQILTDEDLARKLQSEWDAEDQENNGSDGTGVVIGAGSRDGESSELRKDATLDQRPRTPRTSPGVKIDRVAISNTRSEREDMKTDTLSLQSTASIRDTLSSTIPFDESPLTFDPTKYIPDLKIHWAKEGGDASYGLLTRCFILVNSTQSRIKIVDTLVNFLSTIIEGDPESLLPAVGIYRHPHILRYSKFSNRSGLPRMRFRHPTYLLSLVLVDRRYRRR